MMLAAPPRSLESAVPLLLEHLPDSFASVDARPPLWACARLLPPIIQGYLEARLDGSSDQVDFHQFYKRKDIAPARAFFERSTPPFDHPVWARVRAFLIAWDNQLLERVNALFLEFDRASTDPACILPSLFISFDPIHAADRSATILDTLAVLCDLPAPPPAFQRCFEGLHSPEMVTHLGVMLARPNAPFRLNVRMESWDRLLPYLCETGWRGDFDGLARLIEWLPAYVEHYTLALDVDSAIHSQVGLELFFPSGEEHAERARRFLAALVERGLCAPPAAEGMVADWKWINPVNTKAAWPDDLILQSLRDPEHRLSAILLRPSHVKLTLYPGGRIAAKSYLSFEHRWLSRDNG